MTELHVEVNLKRGSWVKLGLVFAGYADIWLHLWSEACVWVPTEHRPEKTVPRRQARTLSGGCSSHRMRRGSFCCLPGALTEVLIKKDRSLFT